MLPTVGQYMDRVVVTVSADTPILDCVNTLLDKGVTGAPVVDSAGKIVGMVTEKDCLRILSTGQNASKPSGCVGDFMTRQVKTIKSGMNIYFAAGLFLGNNFRRFPVVDDGELVGAITRYDILRAIAKHYE